MFMEMAHRSRPSVFHQQLFAVIILQCWCQTRPPWRGEANGPFSPPCINQRDEEGKNLIHLKCGAAGLWSERASVQRGPIKGALCNIRLQMMEMQPQKNHREYFIQVCKAAPFTQLLRFGDLLFYTTFQSWKKSTTIVIIINTQASTCLLGIIGSNVYTLQLLSCPNMVMSGSKNPRWHES